ncbi:GL14109 [Drosophila persimilis]|uniref:UDP-glucuronosyltransferase n=1 Tax=Drosophila persimilis TaxID=7234 RepID=B4GQL6_DROPE|nr:UDP-glucuronosyltransferase 1-1 [Drosophila persimilis]EDW39888.1 GL14109 [Drosophila persimilis]
MNRPPISHILLWMLAICSAVGVESHHILGLFVNLHRSQLLVHMAVTRALLQRGHQVTLVTTLPLEEVELEGNVTHILVPWQQPADEDHLGSATDWLLRLLRMFNRLEQSGDLLDQPAWKDFMRLSPKPHFDLLLLGYHFNDHLLGVAAHFNCPAAIISTQQPIGFVNSLMGNPEERWYVPQPYDSRQRSGISAWLFGAWEKLMEAVARRVLRRIYSSHFPEPHYPPFETMRRSVALALNNHHMISEGPIAPLLPSMVDIGGILLEQKLNETFLEVSGNRSLIVFSLGTRFTWKRSPDHFVQTFTQAFAQFPDYDIYWTYDGPNASEIMSHHSHLKLAKWWPQRQLLGQQQACLFITHGGKGSLTEALYYGVPMVGLPLLGDQRANLLKMGAKGWGMTLSTQNLRHAELSKAMGSALSHSRYSKSISKASHLYRDRPMNASDVATFWLEYVIRHRGAKHLYSPARQLDFMQYYSLDVYAIVYGGLVLLIAVLRRINSRLSVTRSIV